MLGQHQDAHRGAVLCPDRFGGPKTLVGVGGRHPMSTIATSGRCSRVARRSAIGIAHLGDHVEPGFHQDPRDPFAHEQRIVREDESECHGRVWCADGMAGRPGRHGGAIYEQLAPGHDG